MEIKKTTKYEILFDRVDKRINIDGVENYKYLPSEIILSDTKEKAIEYTKGIIDEVKAMHLTDSVGNEISIMMNGFSHQIGDYETTNKGGFYWFYLSTPRTTDKYGYERYVVGIEVHIKKMEVTEIV